MDYYAQETETCREKNTILKRFRQIWAIRF